MTIGRINNTTANNLHNPAAVTSISATAKSNYPNPNPTKECSNCGTQTAHFLHQVRLLGIHRRLCTSCVLRLHTGSFCPSCFAFYGSPPKASNHVSCSNCSSLTHPHCAGDTTLSSYLCPPCKDPSFSFFPIKDNKIDKKLALALVCAANIAAASMRKAVTVAWMEADRKTREAAVARKRAREALEHLVRVTNAEKNAIESAVKKPKGAVGSMFVNENHGE